MSRRGVIAEKTKDAAKVAAVVGRRIVKAEPNGYWEEDGENSRWMHAWRLTLDDGTVLTFMTEEHPEGAEYGTDMLVHPACTKKT